MTVTRQKIYSVLRKAGYPTAQFHRSGMVRGWGTWSSGVQVEKMLHGADWKVGYVFYGHVSDNARIEKLQAIQKVLLNAGIQCYPNEQETALIVGDIEA